MVIAEVVVDVDMTLYQEDFTAILVQIFLFLV